jgi:hypothetical protein
MPYDFTYFAPTGNPATDASAKQITPTSRFTADTLDDIREFIEQTVTRHNHKGGSGYIIAGDCAGTRSARNTGPAGFALLDWDDAPPDWAELDQYEGFGWTTHNHTEAEPHWRFVIPFEEPVLHGKLPDPFPGAHLRNRAQPAFLPTHAEDATLIKWRVLGGSKRLKAEAEAAQTQASSPVQQTILYEMFRRAGWLRGEGPNDGVWVRCPWAHEHSPKAGEDTPDESGTGVLPNDDGLGLFSCRHGHCSHRHSGDAFAVLSELPCNASFRTKEPSSPKASAGGSPSLPVGSERVTSGTQAGVPGSPSPVPRGPVLTGADLDGEIPPVQWLVEELQLCPGRPPILAADSGAGKSWATQALALAVASGQPVFGQFPCRQGPVLHVAQDSGLSATRRRYQRLARGMGLSLAQLPIAVWTPRLELVDKWGKFVIEGLAGVDAQVTKMGAVLVILDSLATICAGLEENSVEIAQPLWATTDTTCTWLWTHHTTKSGEVMRGSSAIKAAAGAIWGLSKNGADREWGLVKPCEETDGSKPPSFVTQWIQNGDAARIEVSRTGPNGANAETPAQRLEREIVTAIRERGARSKNQVCDMVRGKRTTILEYLKDLTIRGIVVVRDNGKLVLAAGSN